MAKRESQTDQSRRPIKVILPNQGKERRPSGGGSKATPFRPVNQEFRMRLWNQVAALRRAVCPFHRGPVACRCWSSCIPALLRSPTGQKFCSLKTLVRLSALGVWESFSSRRRLEDLISYRPSLRAEILLSSSRSCPLLMLSNRLRRGYVAAVGPPTIFFATVLDGTKDLLRAYALFDFGEKRDQERLISDFLEICDQRDITVGLGGYSDLSFVYEAECRSVADVEALANTIGVRSISQMPLLRIVRPTLSNLGSLPSNLPSAGSLGSDVPVVVVVDSGVSEDIPELESWVVGRESDVPPEYRNTEHGTFVAGLVAWGDRLNPTINCIDSSPCAIFDLQVLPNDDLAKGDTDTVSESEFLQSLETALREHRE